MAGIAGHFVPPGGRRVHPLDLHLTLRFLGELSDQALCGVERAVDGLSHGPVSLHCDLLGCFRRSGVLWFGPTEAGSDLIGLVVDLNTVLVDAGLPAEPRPFVPHITLARRVERCPRDARPDPVIWTADALCLAAGRSGHLPRYAVRRSWPLTGAAPQGERA